MNKIAVFASGTGSNFNAIYEYMNKVDFNSQIALVITNNPIAAIIQKAEKYHIPNHVIRRNNFDTYKDYSSSLLHLLTKYKIDFIALAGYLVKIPKLIIHAYENKILNIHPALLPAFGGKGFYGINVHNAVIASGVKISGITIHFVNENYDKGAIILQKIVNIAYDDTAETLASKVLKLEHHWYPKVIQFLCENKIHINKRIVNINES